MMLRLAGEVGDVFPSSPHFDPVLLRSPRLYRRFVRQLHQRGMLVHCPQPRETVGLFFVLKSDGLSQRLIVDARRSNCHFRTAPGVELLTGEGLGRVEVAMPEGVSVDSPEGQKILTETVLHLGMADAKDCFHRMRIPGWLSAFFTLPPVPAKDIVFHTNFNCSCE